MIPKQTITTTILLLFLLLAGLSDYESHLLSLLLRPAMSPESSLYELESSFVPLDLEELLTPLLIGGQPHDLSDQIPDVFHTFV